VKTFSVGQLFVAAFVVLRLSWLVVTPTFIPDCLAPLPVAYLPAVLRSCQILGAEV